MSLYADLGCTGIGQLFCLGRYVSYPKVIRASLGCGASDFQKVPGPFLGVPNKDYNISGS